VPARVLAHKADTVYSGMSGAPSNEIKGEPQKAATAAQQTLL